MPQPNETMARVVFRLDRGMFGRYVQFVTGHNYLKYHMFNTRRSDTDLCRRCEEGKETSWHLIAECPAFARDRWNLFQLPFLEEPPTPAKILDFVRLFDVERMLRQREQVEGRALSPSPRVDPLV